MTLALRPLTPVLGAEITGVDLAKPIPEADFREIEAAFEEHSVLVFPEQHLDDAAQIAFSERFGPLEATVGANPGGAGTAFAVFSNVAEDGSIIPPEDRRMVFDSGNRMWHTDSSYKPTPAKASLLLGRRVPKTAGETEFASLRAAYDALSDDERAAIETYVVVHDFAFSRGKIDPSLLTQRDFRESPPVRHALVRVNPANGRRAVLVGAHASYIDGVPLAEGRALIERLNSLATRPENVYTHQWKAGDLVMWDNRAVLHRGRPYDPAEARVMQRTTVAGTPQAA